MYLLKIIVTKMINLLIDSYLCYQTNIYELMYAFQDLEDLEKRTYTFEISKDCLDTRTGPFTDRHKGDLNLLIKALHENSNLGMYFYREGKHFSRVSIGNYNYDMKGLISNIASYNIIYIKNKKKVKKNSSQSTQENTNEYTIGKFWKINGRTVKSVKKTTVPKLYNVDKMIYDCNKFIESMGGIDKLGEICQSLLPRQANIDSVDICPDIEDIHNNVDVISYIVFPNYNA